MKASTISAGSDFSYTYNGYTYKFYVGEGNPETLNLYSFDTDVLDYVIRAAGQGAYYRIVNTSDIKPLDWVANGLTNSLNSIFSTITNAYIATREFVSDYLVDNASVYSFTFYLTGVDPDYEGSGDYGTAYGFRFVGAFGDVCDLVLDSQGNFYGHNRIGNYTFDPDPEPYTWIGQNVDPNSPDVYIPQIRITDFNDLLPPYFEGNKLYFYIYENDIPILCSFDNVENCAFVCNPSWAWYGSGVWIGLIDGKSTYGTIPTHTFTYGNNSVTFTQEDASNIWKYFTLNNTQYTGYIMFVKLNNYFQNISANLPFYKGANNNTFPNSFDYSSYNVSGILNGSFVNGSGPSLFLQKLSYTPTVNPNPIPEEPIPISQIPDDPDDPLPDTPSPDPIPGIEYPINPTPIPLPPFATIVSGNDDLWGLTVDLNVTENSLLPYINSLATFEFPSFDSLISDFSGSIIWVAQIMSVLYNGTSFNILFIVLCLFSLVSIIIGGYKLWSTTEPDPNNPGFRRTKKPPKGPKGRRRR